MAPRLFDLNIEEVLDNWEVEHALREIIANALDEQLLSKTRDIEISKDKRGYWHIRDFGRGLRIEHFTLNEDQEKLTSSAQVIGKFGVGLKDALATFHRRGVDVYIRSSAGTYQLRQSPKHDFDGIITLHVSYGQPPPGFVGTEFVFRGVTGEQVDRAKSLFLTFAGEQMIETTPYGDVLQRRGESGRVYILGVFASEEPNFLFSYNITSLTDAMKKRLNRERLNVGRTTYAERVKSILKSSQSDEVHRLLVDQVRRRAVGDQCDEMSWIEISQMALNLMHKQAKVVYFREADFRWRPNVLDNARSDGYEPVVVSDRQYDKLEQQMASGGPEVRVVEKYVEEYNASFKYEFVDPVRLTRDERTVYALTPELLRLVGVSPDSAPQIRISETMRVTYDDTGGVWDQLIPAVVIRRSALSCLSDYAGTLLHEVAHATTGAIDSTREFERVLTQYLGRTATAAVKR
jgi:hypothetical protein